MANDFQSDIAVMRRIEAVPAIVDVVCRMTGVELPQSPA